MSSQHSRRLMRRTFGIDKERLPSSNPDTLPPPNSRDVDDAVLEEYYTALKDDPAARARIVNGALGALYVVIAKLEAPGDDDMLLKSMVSYLIELGLLGEAKEREITRIEFSNGDSWLKSS